MRNESFTAVVGSTNYNTVDKFSDTDMKIYQYPTFSDLYHNKDFSKGYTSENDVEIHDIRKLDMMLWKANVNFIELLFSQEWHAADDLYARLQSRREDIARMNLPYLFNACMGMYLRSIKDFDRDKKLALEAKYKNEPADKVQYLVRKANKRLASSYRIANFIVRYAANGFESFQEAIRYKETEGQRKIILDIRASESFPTTNFVLASGMESQALALRPLYHKQKPDEDTREWVEEEIKKAVIDNLKEELKYH